MPLKDGERYAATIKRKDGWFRRAVCRAKGAQIIRWEWFDGDGNERPPKASTETVSKPEDSEEPMPAKPKVEAEGKGAEGAQGGEKGAGRNWWPWIAVGGFLVVGAAVGAALWTRRDVGVTGGGLLARLRLVKDAA